MIRNSARLIFLSGFPQFAFGCASFVCFMQFTSNPLLFFVSMVICGSGLGLHGQLLRLQIPFLKSHLSRTGMVIATLLTAIQNSVEKPQMARSTAAVNFTNRFGASIGLASCNAVYNSFAPVDVYSGVKFVFLTTCLPALLAAVVLSRMPKKRLDASAPELLVASNMNSNSMPLLDSRREDRATNT